MLDPGAILHLTGFTDCLGSGSSNANLRMNRASAVEDYFVLVLGVDRNRVFVETAAEVEYLDTNETPIGRAANRAVAISWSPAAQRLDRRMRIVDLPP